MENTKTAKRTAEDVINDILTYFKDNPETFNNCIEELDSYNGYLNDDRYYDMYLLDEFYADTKPIDLLYRVFYGCDEDTTYTDERGERHYSEFNPNREYFRYNGYGNLVSSNYKDYSDHLDNYAVEQMQEYRRDIYSIDDDAELSELFDELENISDENDA